MPKAYFAVDAKNRLVAVIGKRKIIVPGTFSIDRNNNLLFSVSENKSWKKKYALPPRIVFEGNWKLDKKHNLIFVLRKNKKKIKGQKIYLRGQINKVKANSLVFALSSLSKNNVQIIQMLKLQGKWQADKYNRLVFLIRRDKTTHDRLTLQGDWSVRNNTIAYRYRTTALKTKKAKDILLRFNGFWQINKSRRITYILEGENDSQFSFTLHKGPNSINAKKGEIKFRSSVGIGIKQKRAKSVKISGIWKIKKAADINFQVNYGNKVHLMRFKAGLHLSKTKKITLLLRNAAGENLGLRLELEQKFLNKNGRIFLKAGKFGKNPEIECGLNLRF